MARMTNSKGMFKFNSYLQVNKQAVSKDGYTSLYIYVYIGAKGRQELDRIPLGIRWPVDKIDFASNTLIRRQRGDKDANDRSEEHTSELQSLLRIPYADFYL